MKKILFTVAMTICIAISTLPIRAQALDPASASTNVQIPDSIKTISELGEYLQSHGIVKTFADYKAFMEKNKPLIQKLNPNLIDYGFTTNLYSEINTPVKINSTIKVTYDYGSKELKPWVVPVIIINNSDQPQEIGKDNFTLVPKVIPTGSELMVLALDPEYIMDAATGNIHGDFMLPPKNEVHLNVVFYVSLVTHESNVNLRVYDGKDHTDVNVVKNE